MERAWLYKPGGLETRTSLNSSDFRADLCFHQSPPLGYLLFALRDGGVWGSLPGGSLPSVSLVSRL